MKLLGGSYRIHYHHPVLQGLAAVVLVALLAFGGWMLYQAGYALGGDGKISVRDEARDLQRRVSTLERTNRELIQRNAQLERDQLIIQESARHVRESLQDMEARYRSMEEELAFYRSIVSPENLESGLHIHSLTLEPVGRGGEYVYHVVLTQIRGNSPVEGTLEFSVTGRQGTEMVELEGDALGEGLQGQQPFGFRYFQNLEGRIRIPEGVSPRSLRVVARTGGDRPRQVEQGHAWDAVLKSDG